MVRIASENREYGGGEGIPYWPREKPGPKKGHAYGLAGIMQQLRGVDLPANKEELIDQIGNREFEYFKGEPMRMDDVLEQIPEGDYDTAAELAMAIADVLEGERAIENERRRKYVERLWGEERERQAEQYGEEYPIWPPPSGEKSRERMKRMREAYRKKYGR